MKFEVRIALYTHFFAGQAIAQKVGICVCSCCQSRWIWGVWGSHYCHVMSYLSWVTVLIIVSKHLNWTIQYWKHSCVQSPYSSSIVFLLHALSHQWINSSNSMLSLACICILLCLCHFQLTWFRYPVYRFWRKNTAYFGPDTCGGVDLNRNFDAFWSGVCPSACMYTSNWSYIELLNLSTVLCCTTPCFKVYVPLGITYITCLYRYKGIFANGMYIGDGCVAMATCIQCACCRAHYKHALLSLLVTVQC